MNTFLAPIELGNVYTNEVNNYSTCDCQNQKPIVIVLNGNQNEETTNIFDNQSSQNILGDTINEIKGLIGELKSLIVKDNKVKKSNNPFAQIDDEAIKAKKDREIEKLCLKLDKAGINKKKVDKLQDKITSEEFEDLAPSKQKKVAKAIKELNKLVNKERLTAGDKAKIDKLVNKILDLVKEVKPETVKDKPKADAPVVTPDEPVAMPDEPVAMPDEPVVTTPDTPVDDTPATTTDDTNAKNMASDVADINETVAEIKRSQVIARGERAWDKHEKVLESGNDSKKVEVLKKLSQEMTKEEFTVFVLKHLDSIVESAFDGINDTDTLSFIYKTLDKDINKSFILPTPKNDDERAKNYKIQIKEIAQAVLGADYEKYTR